MNKPPSDRVCVHCNAIIRWSGTPTRGQYRHSRPGGQLYVTTHPPVPRPSVDDYNEDEA